MIESENLRIPHSSELTCDWCASPTATSTSTATLTLTSTATATTARHFVSRSTHFSIHHGPLPPLLLRRGRFPPPLHHQVPRHRRRHRTYSRPPHRVRLPRQPDRVLSLQRSLPSRPSISARRAYSFLSLLRHLCTQSRPPQCIQPDPLPPSLARRLPSPRPSRPHASPRTAPRASSSKELPVPSLHAPSAVHVRPSSLSARTTIPPARFAQRSPYLGCPS